MITTRPLIWILSSLIVLTGGVVFADEFSSEIELKARNIFQSDVDAQSGHIAIYETSVEVRHDGKIAGKMPFVVGLNAGHIGIDHNLGLELPSRLESRSARLGVKLPAPFLDSEHYFTGIDIFPTLNTNDGNWASGAFRVPFRAYLIYKESDNFIVIAGLKIRPEYDTLVLPIIGIIYKPNDRLSFNLGSSDPNITYQLTDKTKLMWELDFTSEEYEVTRGTQNGVVLKYKEVSTGAGVEHQFTKNIRANVTVGGVFGRRLEYKDDQGKVVPDAGLYAGARVYVNF